MQIRPDGEMDIISAFEAAVPGSNPGRGTRERATKLVALEIETSGVVSFCAGGHGLVVERVLAKDETGFRLSLPAPLCSGQNVITKRL